MNIFKSVGTFAAASTAALLCGLAVGILSRPTPTLNVTPVPQSISTSSKVAFETQPPKSTLLASPVSKQSIDRSSWSPTYAAARNYGHPPVVAQAFSTLCQEGIKINDSSLCVKAEWSSAQKNTHIARMALAAQILVKSGEMSGMSD